MWFNTIHLLFLSIHKVNSFFFNYSIAVFSLLNNRLHKLCKFIFICNFFSARVYITEWMLWAKILEWKRIGYYIRNGRLIEWNSKGAYPSMLCVLMNVIWTLRKKQKHIRQSAIRKMDFLYGLYSSTYANFLFFPPDHKTSTFY